MAHEIDRVSGAYALKDHEDAEHILRERPQDRILCHPNIQIGEASHAVAHLSRGSRPVRERGQDGRRIGDLFRGGIVRGEQEIDSIYDADIADEKNKNKGLRYRHPAESISRRGRESILKMDVRISRGLFEREARISDEGIPTGSFEEEFSVRSRTKPREPYGLFSRWILNISRTQRTNNTNIKSGTRKGVENFVSWAMPNAIPANQRFSCSVFR